MMSRGVLLLFCFLMIKHFKDVAAQKSFVENKYSKVVLPEKYNLWLIPFFENFTYWGKASIDFSVLDSTNQLIVIGDRFELKDIVLRSLESNEIIKTSFNDKTDFDHFLFLTSQSLIGNYSIDITFYGEINSIKTNEGLFYNLYIMDETDRFYVASAARDIDKCNLFPCLSDPVTPVLLTVNIARFETQTSNSNMPVVSTSLPDENIEGRVWDMYEQTARISPTTVGITVHELTAVSSLKYSLFSNPETTNQSDFAVAYLLKAADSLKLRLKTDTLPFYKLDVIALPDSNEEKTHHPGLVFCREDQILYQEGVSNANNKERVVLSVANILVQQLFAEQIYRDGWLVEGIVSYLEYKLLSKLEDSWNADGKFFTNIVQEALLEDNMEMNSSNKGQKVAAIFKMLEGFMQEDFIIEGIYNLSRERGLITLENVMEVFNQSVATEKIFDFTDTSENKFLLSKFLQTWILQPGYPVLEVQVNNSTISLKEKDCLQNQLTWPLFIQLSCELDSSTNTSLNTFWITESQTTGEFPCNQSTEWFLINPHQKGYYRVNYDLASWQRLTDQLRRNHSQLSVGVRSQLIEDAFQLARLRELEYSVVLKLTEYLVNETDIVPWTAAVRSFEQLIRLFCGTELATELQFYARELISGFYNSTHRMFSAKDSHVKKTSRLHVLYWACHWNMPSCIDFTAMLFKQWMSSSIGFPAEYKYVALCTGVQHFPESFFDVVDSLSESTLDSDRRVHLSALTCSSNTSHLLYLLRTAFLSKNQMIFGHYDKPLLFKEIIKTQKNVPFVVEFLVQNYNLVNIRCGESLIDSIWTSLGQSCLSSETIQIIEQYVENASLPLLLRENLNVSLIRGKKCLKESEELAPLVLEAFNFVNNPSFSFPPPNVLLSSDGILSMVNFNVFIICMTFVFTLSLVLKKII